MRLTRLLPFVLISLLLAGCDDLSSPQGVVGTAYQAVTQGKLDTFRETLTGDALARHGNAAAMEALRARLGGQELAVTRTTLARTEHDLRGWTSLREFDLEITGHAQSPRPGSLAGGEPVRLSALVRCEVSYFYKERWDTSYPSYPPFPGHPGSDFDCRMREGHLGYCHFEELSFCQVARLD